MVLTPKRVNRVIKEMRGLRVLVVSLGGGEMSIAGRMSTEKTSKVDEVLMMAAKYLREPFCRILGRASCM